MVAEALITWDFREEVVLRDKFSNESITEEVSIVLDVGRGEGRTQKFKMKARHEQSQASPFLLSTSSNTGTSTFNPLQRHSTAHRGLSSDRPSQICPPQVHSALHLVLYKCCAPSPSLSFPVLKTLLPLVSDYSLSQPVNKMPTLCQALLWRAQAITK